MSELTPPISITEIRPKMKLVGAVKKVQLAGAIVEAAGHLGLLHISQIRRKRVNNVADFLTEGQEVEVWVRSVDVEKERLQFTMIEPPALEWHAIEIGQVYTGKVIRIEKFGVFVDIGAERAGLVHISELSADYVKNAGDVVAKNDDVEVKVIGLDQAKNQIDLSIKALAQPKQPLPPPVESEDEEVGTAMAFAFQKAQSPKGSAKSDRQSRKKQRDTQEDIISRTLKYHQ